MNTMNIDRLRFKDLEETLANSMPLLAIVGAGDLAVEKLKAAREEFATRSAQFDPKACREQAQATFAGGVEAFQAEMQAAPEQIRALPEKAQEWPAIAQALVADAIAGALTTYGELAGRGKAVVDTMRGEHAEVERPEPVTRPATAKTTAKRAPKTSAAKTTPAKTSSAKTSAAKTPATKKSTTKKASANRK